MKQGEVNRANNRVTEDVQVRFLLLPPGHCRKGKHRENILLIFISEENGQLASRGKQKGKLDKGQSAAMKSQLGLQACRQAAEVELFSCKKAEMEERAGLQERKLA